MLNAIIMTMNTVMNTVIAADTAMANAGNNNKKLLRGSEKGCITLGYAAFLFL